MLFLYQLQKLRNVPAFTLCPWRVDLLQQGPTVLTQKGIDMPLEQNTWAIQDKTTWVPESETFGSFPQMHMGNIMYERYDGGNCFPPVELYLLPYSSHQETHSFCLPWSGCPHVPLGWRGLRPHSLCLLEQPDGGGSGHSAKTFKDTGMFEKHFINFRGESLEFLG